MTENNTNTHIHSCDEVMKAIEKLPEEEKEVILFQMNIPQLAVLLDSAEKVEEYKETLQKYIDVCTIIMDAISKLYELVNAPEDAVNDVIEDYSKLDSTQKKETALRLLNNNVFQRDCCDILIKDMERVTESDSTLKALDNLFGLVKYFKNCIRLGIGTDHKYEVEQ